MTAFPEGNALVYCEGAFETLNGKTAHGLVRRTRRYRVLGVIDSHVAGRDAGDVLDGRPNGIPIYESVEQGVNESKNRGLPATHLVIGIAPDGGRLDSGNKTVPYPFLSPASCPALIRPGFFFCFYTHSQLCFTCVSCPSARIKMTPATICL